ncbi:hypothetical protein NPIL_550331 [Nephila pilipes]|uniref:Uncharacterized protein n=1 Tax=Nephila pilipes TaxID=299642 RepID=A0A8X6NLI9_NEPPI|nr:hypothetical protein NPIL_550331 [Nephila pilipes]
MIKRFEATEKLNILPVRGRKQVDKSSFEDVVTAAIYLSSQSPYGNASLSSTANEIDMPITMVRKVMRNILRYYPFTIQRVQQL